MQTQEHCQPEPTPRLVPTFVFIGVTTAHSSMMRIFPRWAQALGRPEVAIEGMDFPLHADPASYRQAVAAIRRDPNVLGGLVTTHKIDLLEAARDLFDYLDPYAQVTGEVSCISRRNSVLEGRAVDPVTAGLVLDVLLGEDYFAHTGGDVLCLGAGGAASAIALHFIDKARPGDRPHRVVAVDLRPDRLERLQAMVDSLDTPIPFTYVCNGDPAHNDALMAALPPGSLVINATGLGKDRPGSPLTGAALFPLDGIVWELNYRGELDFMHQAVAQQESRRLVVEDGWRYFLHGWTHVVAQVFQITVDRTTFDHLAAIAAEWR